LWSETQGEATELHWQGKIRGPNFAAFSYRLRPVATGLSDVRGIPEITVIAEPTSDEAIADLRKQTIANEDVILRSIRDYPDRSMADRARDAGWLDKFDQPEKWRAQRAIVKLAKDKLIQQPREGAPWKLTDKGKEALQ
jgi:hypothetical protein